MANRVRQIPIVRRLAGTLVISVLIGAVLVVGYVTLRNNSEEVPVTVEEGASSTTIVTDDSAVRLYADQVSILAADVADLGATARQINQDWDSDAEDYTTTLGRMSALLSRVNVLPHRFSTMAVPPEADPFIHQWITGTLSTLISVAEGMMAGLESVDAGESRLEQLVRFEEAVLRLDELATQVELSLETQGPTPATASSEDGQP